MSLSLVASAARTSSNNSGALTPFGQKVGRLKAALFFLSVTAAATESSDTLDVYVQHSPDDGTTWDDFIHFTQVLGNGGAKKFIASWTRDVTPESELKAPADGSLAAGVLQGPIAPTIRVKWVIVDSGTQNASFTFSLVVSPVYD